MQREMMLPAEPLHLKRHSVIGMMHLRFALVADLTRKALYFALSQINACVRAANVLPPLFRSQRLPMRSRISIAAITTISLSRDVARRAAFAQAL